MRQHLETLISGTHGRTDLYIQATGWFFDVAWEDIEPIIREFRQKFVPKRVELIELLGEPTWSLPQDHDWFYRWYPEALEAAAWDRGDKVICLAVDHHDKETPVALLLRCFTKVELAKLLA
jgi:hypothetical protein